MNHDRERLRRKYLKYDSLASQEEFQTQLNLEIYQKQMELAQINEEFEQIRHRLGGLLSQEELEESLEASISQRQKELNELTHRKEQLNREVARLQKQVNELEEEEDVQSFGFYQPRYEFLDAGSFAAQIKKVKAEQRRMIRDREAAVCNETWIVESSKKQGRLMAQNFLKLMLNKFNTECSDLISKVKPSNVEQTEKKIKKSVAELNKAGEVFKCEITKKYLSLKLQELQLQYQAECERLDERAREQAIREEDQERRRAERLMKAAEEAEERENTFRQHLEIAQIKLREEKLVLGMEREKLELQIQQLQRKLAEATSDKEKANSQAAMTKAGYIYIISNVGSFGRDVYRICMTKKSGNPDEYISSMSPVVPFPFDIHFRFLSEDSLDTLNRLQQRFSSRRINKANERRGFFKVSLDEIAQAVEEIRKEGVLKNIHFERTPQAYEYRRTIAAERKDNQTSTSHGLYQNDETA